MNDGNEDGLRDAQICEANASARVSHEQQDGSRCTGARGSGPAATRLAGLGALALQLQVVRQVLHGAGLGGVLAAHQLRLRRGVSTRTRQAKQCGRLRCWGMRMCRRSRCGCGRSWRPRWPGAWSRSAPARKAQRSACGPLRSTQAAVRTLFAAVRASRSSVSAAWALGAAKKTADSAARPRACACGTQRQHLAAAS